MRVGGAFLSGLVGLVLWAGAANAATIEVETDVDEFGGGGTSACTLREAIEAASSNQAFGGCPKGSKKADRIEVPADVALTRDAGAGNAGGDLNHEGGGKLTIVGTGASSSAIIPEASWDFRALELTGAPVAIKNIEISGYSPAAPGGAVRATGKRTALKLIDVQLSQNDAGGRGGAVACEGCKRLELRGHFTVTQNTVVESGLAQGGAIWSNGPVVVRGNPVGLNPPSISGNEAVSVSSAASGGAIYAEDDLTIERATLLDNIALGNSGYGGAVSAPAEDGEKSQLRINDATFDGNTSTTRGGAIETTGPAASLKAKRIAVTENTARLGGGIFTQANVNINEAAIDSNVAPAGASPGEAPRGGGFFANSGDAAEATIVRLTKVSVTRNELQGGATQLGGGLFASGVDLRLANSTVGSNSAPEAAGQGGGLAVFSSTTLPFPAKGTAEISFSTFRGNVAGVGATDGDAIRSEAPLKARANIIDESGDNCSVGGLGTNIESQGFNVQDGADVDCGFDAATDVDGDDFLTGVQENGSPVVGLPGVQGFDQVTIPLTNTFTNNASVALDIVPPNKCKVRGKELKTDARGVPRPQEDGCDAGATERVACRGVFVVGPNADIGRNGRDQIQGSHTENDVVLAQGGDDQINIYGDEDTVCAGGGDDSILAGESSNSPDVIDGGPGSDFISYNNGGPVTLDLDAQGVIGPNTGIDELHSIEDAQGSEGDDEIGGSDGPNLLIGGGNADTILGRGGIDVIDAKDGEADIEINCGPGDNSQERATFDEGLDPAPVSC